MRDTKHVKAFLEAWVHLPSDRLESHCRLRRTGCSIVHFLWYHPNIGIDTGVDYLKYDNCNYDYDTPEWQLRYNRMRDALLKYWNQPILYAICEWGDDNVWTWGNETGHSWRIFHDILPYSTSPYN